MYNSYHNVIEEIISIEDQMLRDKGIPPFSNTSNTDLTEEQHAEILKALRIARYSIDRIISIKPQSQVIVDPLKDIEIEYNKYRYEGELPVTNSPKSSRLTKGA